MPTPDLKFLAELDSSLSGLWISDLPNFCSMLYHYLSDVSWVGFYLNDGKKLRLGPFMGKPACLEIGYDRGVCGASFSREQALIVGDVHAFPGHIACDSEAKSELVLPFRIGGKKIGVLDLDSYSLNRFSQKELGLVERALEVLGRKLPLSSGLFNDLK